MSEAVFDSENDSSKFYQLATKKIFKDLVGTKQREGVISDSLKRKDKLADGQSLEGYIYGEMRFGDSIQSLAYAMFCNDTPPPYDTREVNERFLRDPKPNLNSRYGMKWDYIPLMPRWIEDDLRLESLGILPNDSHELEAIVTRPESINTLVRGIIDSAGVVSWMGRKTYDPENYRNYDSVIQQLLACEPISLEINGARHWAIKVPGSLRESGQFWRQQAPDVPEYIWDQMSSVEDMLDSNQMPMRPGDYPKANFRQPGDYIVVSDSERNSDLSTFVFANDEALVYMTSKYLGKAQTKLQHQLEFDFNQIIEGNILRVQEIVEEVNNPLRVEFFNKLLMDTGEQGTEIIFIVRNNQDALAFQGDQYDTDPSESPSKVIRFAVSKIRQDVLQFNWTTQDLDGQSVKANVKVRCSGKRVEIANMDRDGDDLNDFSRKFGLNVRQLDDLFDTIEILTVSDWFQFGAKQMDGIREMSFALKSCNSSVEFINKIYEFGKAKFPTNQIVVNPGRKVRFEADSSTALHLLQTQWN